MLSFTLSLAAALTLTACAAERNEMPAALQRAPAAQSQAQSQPQSQAQNQAQTQPADAKVEVPLDEHQASARCWMKYDSAHMSLDQKSRAVDKCIDEVMRSQHR